MGFKVLITDSAIADLREIVEFVAQDDPDATVRLGEKLIARAMSLENMPERFPLHDKERGISQDAGQALSALLQVRPRGICREHPALLAQCQTAA